LTGATPDRHRLHHEREALGEADTTIDRTEFGVNWNVPLPDGKPALADEVKLSAELHFVKEA
jgi:polyisoprenoid-binding protein YceI